MVPNRKQAGANLSVGGSTNAAAVSEKRMRHRRDNPDFANAVIKPIAPGGFAARLGNFNQWPVFVHTLQDFLERNHFRTLPYPVFCERHEVDKTQDHAV